MRKPLWEESPGSLVAWLAANKEARHADLYTITLRNGTVVRLTDCDVQLIVNGQTWAAGPGLQRTRTKQTIGISVDTMTLEVYDSSPPTYFVNSIGVIQHIALGNWDGARVQVDVAFYDAEFNAKGVVPIFLGRVGPVKASRGAAVIEVRSAAELLDIKVPGDLYQPSCKNTVYDAFCMINKAAYTTALEAKSSGLAGREVVAVSGSAVPAAHFEMGVMTFTSGANNGTSRTVKRAYYIGTSLAFELVTAFPNPIVLGDDFTVAQGCNKTLARCSAQFANTGRFRGEPFIPAPETVL